jgi:hypothetical protein
MKKIFSKTTFTVIGFLLLIAFGVVYGYSIIRDIGKPPETTDFSQYIQTSNGIQTFQQTFDNPVDPNVQQTTHVAVYKTIASITHFDIEYPTDVPDGFGLVSVDATEGEESMYGIGGEYYGLNTTTYRNEGGATIEVLQGYVDLGFFPEPDKIDIGKGIFVRKWPSAWGHGFTLYREGEDTSTYLYHVTGEGVTDEDLLRVAKSLTII